MNINMNMTFYATTVTHRREGACQKEIKEVC